MRAAHNQNTPAKVAAQKSNGVKREERNILEEKREKVRAQRNQEKLAQVRVKQYQAAKREANRAEVKNYVSRYKVPQPASASAAAHCNLNQSVIQKKVSVCEAAGDNSL